MTTAIVRLSTLALADFLGGFALFCVWAKVHIGAPVAVDAVMFGIVASVLLVTAVRIKP